MKRFLLFFCSLSILIGMALAYMHRVSIRAWIFDRFKPELPVAEEYQPSASNEMNGDKRSATGGSSLLPKQKHLLVPFTPQAPKANWDMPYQEACEEASIIMVAGYYRGDKGTYASSTADKMILDLIRLEEDQFGFGADITSSEAASVIEAYDPSLKAAVVSVTSTDSIKSYVARGIPVIVPADGKVLPNPNFRNGGPVYHMLVVTGYTEDRFITNDPGTRNGYDFTYAYSDLINAIHDWNDGDVSKGRKLMIVAEKIGD